MLPSVEGTVSFRLFHRNLMEGWREMEGDGGRRGERNRRDKERSEEGKEDF